MDCLKVTLISLILVLQTAAVGHAASIPSIKLVQPSRFLSSVRLQKRDVAQKQSQVLPDTASTHSVSAVALAKQMLAERTGGTGAIAYSASQLVAQMPSSSQAVPPSAAEQLNLDPAVIEQSPVLQRWLQDIPDVRSEIRHDPSFRTRLRLGYSQFSSTDDAGGFNVGVEDLFVGQTGLTVSGEYQQSFNGDRQTYGSDLRYYVRPLGSSINVAPVVGYRHLETDAYSAEGVNLGLRLLLALSRTGAADISLTQSWVAPGSDGEVGITTLSFGYALTRHLRLSTDWQRQNTRQSNDSRLGIVLEWML